MANNYRLIIQDVYGKGRDLKLTYNQGKTSSQVIKINYIDCIFTLKNFSYTKAIYQPGEIKITLILTKEKDSFTLSDVKAVHTSLINKSIKLEYSEDSSMSNAFEIAKSYYTFDIQIERKKGSSGVLSVNIKAFDPLKFLTLDKYCMAYTCKKLVLDIISKVDLWPDALPEELKEAITNDRKSITEKEINIENLKKDSEKDSEKDSKKDSKKDSEKNKEAIKQETEKLNEAIQNWWKNENGFFIKNPQFISYEKDKNYFEFIQPYLVQYNESFLDFLVRVTNRCGEFFYYENGKIYIGWKKTGSINIKDYVSVRFPQEISSAWKNDSIADMHNDYTQAEDKNLKNTNKTPTMMRDCELASDENLASIPPKEEYTSWKDFALYPGCFYVNLVSDALCSQNLVDMITDLGLSTAATISSSKNSSNKTNDDYEANNFSGAYKDERMQGNNIHPFSTNDTIKSGIKEKDKQVAYSLAYYANIQKGIESAERSRIQIELGDYFHKISLGSIVKLDSDEYIVVKIDSKINSQDNMDGETLKIEAIPYTKEVTVYPPSAHVDSIRTAKAQRAIVTHNQDPLKMNRVRVRYPWQGTTNTSEDSTPWIRIALPMASNGSGFNFLPEVGDEAMINFENGNIERPYVEGMLYSKGQTVPGDYMGKGARVISSVNGHSIIFSDPSKMNILKTFSPMLKTLGNFMVIPEFSIKDRKAIGGIELTDEYGFYSIAMSSSNRSITISSPLGNVSINAFTGIKISAPNGNISIEGKNINIAAGNNLTLSSGNNIKSHFWPYYKKDGLGKSLLNGLSDLLESAISKFNPIDMGLVRTVMETFLRPIGGTMLIKSNRYMCIEAGKGEAQIAGRMIVNNYNVWKSIFYAYKPQYFDTTIRYKDNAVVTSQIPNYLESSIQAIDAIYSECVKSFKRMKIHSNALNEAYTSLTSDRFKRISKTVSNYNDIKNFDTIYENLPFNPVKLNINNNIANNLKPIKKAEFNKTYKSKITKYNDTISAIEIDVITSEKLIDNICENLFNGNVLSSVLNDGTIKSKIRNLFYPVCAPNYNYRAKNLPTLDIELKREIIYLILVKLIDLQSEVKDVTNIDKVRLSQIGEPKGYDQQQWSEFVNKIDKIIVSGGKKLYLKRFGIKAKEIVLGTFGGFDKLNGVFDQYIWDSNEDSGKILFSDSKGKTLNFNNDTIHYYKKLETADPIKEIKNTLSSI